MLEQMGAGMPEDVVSEHGMQQLHKSAGGGSSIQREFTLLDQKGAAQNLHSG